MSATVAFAGMTHLGINSAAAMAERGFDVIGYDPDVALIDRLRKAQLPVLEPQLDEFVSRNRDRLSFTTDPTDLRRADVTYIAADVATDDRGHSDLGPILELIEGVAGRLDEDAVLVVLSQVPPGFTRGLRGVRPERLFYQVETLIFGQAVERAMHPERFILGCADPLAALPARYREVLEAFACPILPMRYESAELAKISINCCLVSTVSVANTLAELSEAIGADWSEIVPALKLDRRIGPHAYLKPGLGIAGGNLERDLRTVIELARERGTDAGVVEAWVSNSAYRKDWCWRTLRDVVLTRAPRSRIAVLGLAYKENTHSTKGSPALALLAHLEGADVRVYDPVVAASVVPFATPARDALSCVEGADALVIATPWPEFRGLEIEALAEVMAGRVLIDPYALLDGFEAARRGFEYHRLGATPLLAQRGDGHA